MKQVFTATLPGDDEELTAEQKEKRTEDFKLRECFEKKLESRLNEGVNRSLKNHRIFSAVDLAWDADPINKWTYPLMLYAQGRIDIAKCCQVLEDTQAGCSEQFITKNEAGDNTGVRFPRFYDVKVNLVRSIVTRRSAAQVGKYSNLFPHWKYEPRGNRPEDWLQSDVVSQLAEISSDQFGHRDAEEQAIRNMLLYPYVIDFVVDEWEQTRQWIPKETSAEFTPPPMEDVSLDSRITEEGVLFKQPHPSRIFWDNAHPLSSLNTDKGISYLGFWDIQRYGDVAADSSLWNRDQIFYSSEQRGWMDAYAPYFGQYFSTALSFPPALRDSPSTTALNFDMGLDNDREANVGRYTSTHHDNAVVLTHYYEKLAPKEAGLGDYPYPLWLHCIVAGEKTVVWAKWMPSKPGAYAGYNQKDDRQISPSMAHEVLSYQDHLTNLLSYLLLCIKTDNLKIILLDLDQFRYPDNHASAGQIDDTALGLVEKQLKAAADTGEPIVLRLSRSKLKERGLDPDTLIEMIEATPKNAIPTIIQAIAQLLQLVNVLLVMSPQEQGQPAPSGISATESNYLANSTESVYNFISEAVDRYRAAKKRIWYESWTAFGSDDFEVPATKAYPLAVVEAAGLTATRSADTTSPEHLVKGTKANLNANLIFTSRDGAERQSNTQNAANLTQMLGTLGQFIQFGVLNKDQLYEIINTISRAAGQTLNLQRAPDEPNELVPGQMEELMKVIENLTQSAEKHDGEIVQAQQMLQQIQQALGVGQPAQPPQRGQMPMQMANGAAPR